MKYEDYSIEDFLEDDFFRKWALGLDEGSSFFWEQWIAEHPEKREVLLYAKELITSLTYQNKYNPTSKEYLEVLEGIYKRSEQPKKIKKKNNRWFSYAAILFIFTLLGIYFLRFNQESVQEETVAIQTTPALIHKQTLLGQKNLLKFADGSTIKLNAGTSIEYPKVFTKNTREVFLEGEAFFEIAKDSLRPFIVHVDGLKVEVLGTSFNVQAYPEEKQIQVTVASGKVKVASIESTQNDQRESEVILQPLEAAIYQKENVSIIKKEVSDLHEIISWKDGVLVFKKAPFEEVVSEIEKWYGVEFQVEEGITVDGRFNGMFDNTSLEMVLEGLDFSTDYHYEIKESKVYITQ